MKFIEEIYCLILYFVRRAEVKFIWQKAYSAKHLFAIQNHSV